jgi:hypothetical protein
MSFSFFAPKAPIESTKKEFKAESIDVKWLPRKAGGIAQIYSSGLEYALANENMEQCHDFVFCKDFIQDAIMSHLHGGIASIYGFSYNPATQPKLSLDKLRLIVVNSADKSFNDKIPHVIDFLNQFCNKLHLKKTVAYKVENPPAKYKNGCWIIESSGMWQNAPVFVSMYTLLLRVGFIHKTGNDCMDTIKKLLDGKTKPYQSNDKSYMQQGMKGIETILKLGYRKIFYIDTAKNYPKGTNIGTMHNQTGIVAFSGEQSKQVCKYWHRRSLTDPEFAKQLAERKAQEKADNEKAALDPEFAKELEARRTAEKEAKEKEKDDKKAKREEKLKKAKKYW